MSQLTWKTEKRKVKDLKPADYNPRKMTDQEEQDLSDSIEEFGTVIPIVVNIGKRKDILIGGHQRTRLYTKRGIHEVEVMVPSRELTKGEEKKLNLRLNKNTGSWDQEKLKEMDLTMLLEVGFGDDDLQMFFDDVDILDDGYNATRAIKDMTKPTVKPGEVWQLGDHRIMCGDATLPEHVAELMNGELTDVVYCDPPGKLAKKENYDAFIAKSLVNALENSKPNTHVFYWADEKTIGAYQILFSKHNIENKRVCLWVKNNFSPVPHNAFSKAYEPCVYGVRGKPYINANMKVTNSVLNQEVGSGNQTHEEILDIINLWMDKKELGATESQKPITLTEKPLKRCSAPGHIILDLFGGSGSTLIACEQLKRKGRIMEVDPVMASVIVNRWEIFTNLKAKKL